MYISKETADFYINKYWNIVLDNTRHGKINRDITEEFIFWVYGTIGFNEKLEVRIAENPLEAKAIFYNIQAYGGPALFQQQIQSLIGYKGIIQKLHAIANATLIKELIEKIGNPLNERIIQNIYNRDEFENEKDNTFFSIYSTYGGLALLDYLKTEMGLEVEAYKSIGRLHNIVIKSGIYGFYFSNYAAVVSLIPKTINLDTEYRMHSLHFPAIEWGASIALTSGRVKLFKIRGRVMPPHIFKAELTKDDFINETNSDAQAGIYEIVEAKGEGSMLKLLGAEEVDKKTFVHANGSLEEMIFYKTKESFRNEFDMSGKRDVPLAWLKMSCPSTGATYLIPSDSFFNNCEDAAKYHRPVEVPLEIEYSWHQIN